MHLQQHYTRLAWKLFYQAHDAWRKWYSFKKTKGAKRLLIKNERDSDAVIATFLEQQEKLLLLLHQAGA
jgi:hypothetical protein